MHESTATSAPFTHAYDLGALPNHGAEMVLSPSAAERAAISDWLGLLSLDSLKATIQLTCHGDEYTCLGSFTADVVQACVITLEPVPAHLEGTFERRYQLLPRASSSRRRAPAPEPAAAIEISTLDEEGPELLESPVLDLAAPLLEEVSLALDPYPKAPGAVFEAPADEAGPEDSPFAVLQKLKPR